MAQESGNRSSESHLASVLCRVEAKHGDPAAAFDYFRMAIHNHHEAGNTTLISTPLATLAAFFDQLGRYEAAATIAGFAFSPMTAASFPSSAPQSRTYARCSEAVCTNRVPRRART
jgi:hypothetical protein